MYDTSTRTILKRLIIRTPFRAENVPATSALRTPSTCIFDTLFYLLIDVVYKEVLDTTIQPALDD